LEERGASLNKYRGDKITKLCKELEETKQCLASSEDKNTVLSSRIVRLEKDCTELQEDRDKLRSEVSSTTHILQHKMSPVNSIITFYVL